jgi:hypothetical protein
MATDFKTNFTEKDTNVVHFTSTDDTKLTGGIFFLNQMVVHAMFTNVGDDAYNHGWGGNILDIFKEPVRPGRASEIEARVMISFQKIENDIKNIQARLPAGELDSSSTLSKIDLISVLPNLEEKRWEIKYQVYSEDGESLQTVLPKIPSV